ncbi:hypothetical protein Hanom_Chr11g00997361 [Helianthus anomalus]
MLLIRETHHSPHPHTHSQHTSLHYCRSSRRRQGTCNATRARGRKPATYRNYEGIIGTRLDRFG